MASVYISIGSNIDREKNIRLCMNKLRQQFPDIIFSTVYETAAVGFKGDPFYNLAAGFETEWDVYRLDNYFKQLEKEQHRIHHPTPNQSSPSSKVFKSRTLDVDLLLYDDLILQPEKDLPRKEILKYPFVLFPLGEIAPNVIHPEQQKTIGTLCKESTLTIKTMKAIHLD
ncbi:MAG TPA: 2-amino-4-hydroxy-6-hydroxymethyldihydropteridine diphosphokinase [Thiothrix sp.]|nr:2-amino-4-hydroxy-6-hydroxymethyldihydropteridine diphosphokinase [Thiothrix sp.]